MAKAERVCRARAWRRRWALATAIAAGAVAVVPATAPGASSAEAAGGGGCRPRTLVLSAMPVELGPLVDAASGVRRVAGGRHDYLVGRLGGHDAVLSLTGIGPVNARRVTRAALARFRCGARPGIAAVVFSGVAGGDAIGNVVVPARWTADGKRVSPVDAGMLAVARTLPRRGVPLERRAPAGDPACACATSPRLVSTVSVTHRPRVEIGGTGHMTDPFSGRALPCAPGGGDVFGCEPCVLQTDAARDGPAFGAGARPFVDPAFFGGYLSAPPSDGHGYAVEDEETAAVAEVAAAERVPFLGVRAVSDGAGDPLHLPGFPAQFFYYRQLAADNAAATTVAFLRAWH